MTIYRYFSKAYIYKNVHAIYTFVFHTDTTNEMKSCVNVKQVGWLNIV